MVGQPRPLALYKAIPLIAAHCSFPRCRKEFGYRRLNQETDMKFINKLLRDEQGATAIEYGLIAALIAVAAITAMSTLGDSLTETFNGVTNELDDANTDQNTNTPT